MIPQDASKVWFDYRKFPADLRHLRTSWSATLSV